MMKKMTVRARIPGSVCRVGLCGSPEQRQDYIENRSFQKVMATTEQ